MRRMILGTLTALLSISALPAIAPSAQSGAAGQSVTKSDYDRWKTELSNWGRWGKDDQIGAVNLITPAKRRQAAALVKEGFSVSLARDVDTEKAVDNPQPYERQMLAIGSDRFGVAFHGVAHTHLDSLAHINPKMVGKNMMELRDGNGKFHIKERMEAAKKGTSGWQDFTFFNPVTKKIEPKRMYWEKHDDLVFACGAYKAI